MGLISKEMEVTLGSSNIKYYEELGYKIPRIKNKWGKVQIPRGTKIKVKVKDLQHNYSGKVQVECSNCKKIINIQWMKYNKYVKKDSTYYCKKCASIGRIEIARETRLKNGKSFEQWCIENNRQDTLDRWDYELNKYKPNEISYSSTGTNRKGYYFKCPKGIHKSELKNISSFTSGQEGSIRCNSCYSFAQWGIDNICSDFLEKYWDYEKNTISPWEISYGSSQKIWIKCQEKDYHGSYSTTCSITTNMNCRCPYCARKKVHPLDSLGKLLEDKGVLDVWSDKNNKSPYKYTPMSQQRMWWKCLDGKHKDYQRSICNANIYNFTCPECIREKGESLLQEKVRLYLKELKYTILHEYKCTIVPINPKTNYQLPFDNEIKELKLIIEVMGIQHYKINGFHKMQSKKNNTTSKYEFHMQQVRDRYKKIIAKSQGYNYIAIPYWTDDKDETWKELINNKINKT